MGRTPDEKKRAMKQYSVLKKKIPQSTCWLEADDSPCRFNSSRRKNDATFCRSCWFAHEDVGPWLFIRDKGPGGIGERMNHIVHGMAVAAKYNMTFAGAVMQPSLAPLACTWDSAGHTKSNTWPSVCSLFRGVFKVNSALDVLITQLPSNVTVYDNVRQL